MNLQDLSLHFSAIYGQGSAPRIFFAPGRVNLIGEHTDYNGGFVLPCALQFGTYLLIRPNNDHLIRLASTSFDLTTTIDTSAALLKIAGNWTNYPTGIIVQFVQRGIKMSGYDMLFAGDIPNSAGLSSSASIEMVTAFALTVLTNTTQFSMLDLVKLSQRAENEFVGVNCGIMDQFAVGFGQKDHALFLNCKTLEYKPVPFVLNGYTLMVVNTNKQRGLADSKYNERVAECQLAVTYLDQLHPVSSLSDIGFMQFFKMQDSIPDEVIRRRARHVISENQRVLNAVPVLLRGDILQFGALMNASHESLRDNYEVTGIELDTLVEEAMKVNGVVGARMTGAGFGGCTVNIVRNDTVDQFITQVGENYKARTGLEASFYPAVASGGPAELSI